MAMLRKRKIIELLNDQSADSTRPAVTVLAPVVLAAVAEELAPGIAGGRGVLLAGPVILLLEKLRNVREGQRLFFAKREREISVTVACQAGRPFHRRGPVRLAF